MDIKLGDSMICIYWPYREVLHEEGIISHVWVDGFFEVSFSDGSSSSFYPNGKQTNGGMGFAVKKEDFKLGMLTLEYYAANFGNLS